MKALLTTTVLAAILFAAACGGDGGDPLAAENTAQNFGGVLTSGAGRANAAVTEQNKFTLCEQVLWPVYLSYVAALNQVGTSPDTELVRIVGSVSGYALVDSTSVTFFRSSIDRVTFGAKLVYYDYSTDGRLFIGGNVIFDGRWSEIDGVTFPTDIALDGGLNFAGDYSGSIEFLHMSLGIDQDGVLLPTGVNPTGYPTQGNVRILSKGNDMTFSPYSPAL